jgi:hypothetical protein
LSKRITYWLLAGTFSPTADSATVADFLKDTNLLNNGEKFMTKPLVEADRKPKESLRQDTKLQAMYVLRSGANATGMGP